MSHFFAEVYLGDDISVLVAILLGSRGFRAMTTRDAGRLGQNDDAQLDYINAHEMVFLTHNQADFEALHREYVVEGKPHWSIVIASRRVLHAIAGNLLRVLNQMTADELRNNLFYI